MEDKKSTNMDDILDALTVIPNIQSNDSEKEDEPIAPINEEDEMAKVVKGLDELIKSNSEMLEEAKQYVFSTGDAEMFEAYSNISKSQSEAFKNKVKLLTEKQKNTVTLKTKDRELTLKEKLADYTMGKSNELVAQGATTVNHQTNVILSGTREELFDMLQKMKEKEIPSIDV